jgi:hypothetical protein
MRRLNGNRTIAAARERRKSDLQPPSIGDPASSLYDAAVGFSI